MNSEIDVRIFTNSRLLLKILESTSQVAEKGLRQSEAYLKQCLEDKEVGMYAGIEGKEIVADMLTKQGSRQEVLNKLMIDGFFRNALDEKNCVQFRNGEIKVENLTTKSQEMGQEHRKQESQIG